MASTTTNYGWVVPTSSDLVKNGATAISTVGSSVDTSLWNSGFGQAGKNKIINGNFGIWQRGTSGFGMGGGFNADRYSFFYDGTGPSSAITQQTFTPATAPVSGYEGTYYLRYTQTTAGTGTTTADLQQKIEDVRQFAGQTATLSFWAKADTTRTITAFITQNFGSGGSTAVSSATQTGSMTTSWQRFSFTFNVPSISGKTIGTGSSLAVLIRFPFNVVQTVDVWGVQMEYGSVATPFQTASGGSIQGELAMCQRYYWRYTNTGAYEDFGFGNARSTTAADLVVKTPITMRVNPTSIDYASLNLLNNYSGSPIAVTSASLASGRASTNCPIVYVDVASGLTASESFYLISGSSGGSYIGFSAEL
jgi:hypothetical protein